jgi:acetyltransferase-like isoleucine patch superfamily enzyme
MTGAGTVVRKDIPENTLAVGQPARNIRKVNTEE